MNSSTNETSGGFGRTMGTIAAIAVVLLVGVGVFIGIRWYRTANNAVQDKKEITADSLERVVAAVQRLAAIKSTSDSARAMTLVAIANAKAASAQFQSVAELGALRDRLRRSDSALAIAVTKADSAAAAELARPPSLDSMVGILTQQHATDSGATVAQASAANSCLVALSDCAANRARSDSIGALFKTMYLAEKAKSPSKFQTTAAQIGEATDVVIVLGLLIHVLVR